MRFPRILLAVPFIVGGIMLPAVTSAPKEPAPVVVGMAHEGFVVDGVSDPTSVPKITITSGESVTFQNNSRWVHIIGPGQRGLLVPPGAGSMTPRHLLEQDETYTTPAWNTPGTYPITCPVHPDMNAEVVVLP